MSDKPNNIYGIHYEISEPRQNPVDGYFYQRIRQVDQDGNLVGVGEQIHRSIAPGSQDGLVGTSVDLGKLGSLAGDVGRIAWGALRKDPRIFGGGARNFGRDVLSGINKDYSAWPGTESPWEPLPDPRGEDSRVDIAPPVAPFVIGDGAGIGNWWERPGPATSRNDGTWPTMPASPPLPSSSSGGIPGRMAQLGGIDPSNPDQTPGGLLALIQDYMRNNPDGATAR